MIAILSHNNQKNVTMNMLVLELTLKVEAHPGIEPSYKDLQSSA